MAELKNIMESGDSLQWLRPGFRLTPVSSANVPERVIFLNSDSVRNALCFKDGDGNVYEFRMRRL